MTTLINTRADLAHYIDLPLKSLLYILYSEDRNRYYTPKEITKSSGAKRKLHAVKGALKGLQRKALDKLQEEFTPTNHSHGFTRNRSIVSNAIPHQRKKIIVKVDITDFFPTIHFARVKGMFSAPPFKFGEEASTTLAQISCLSGENGQLPQGGVMSPFVANMICRRLDSRMAGIARVFHCNFTRYADDITFSTNDVNKLDIKKLLGQIYQTIEEEGFVPNKVKTKILTPKDRQIVTGIVVNDGINVNRKYIRNIRATIRNIEKYGIDSQIVKKPYTRDKLYKNSTSSRPDLQKTTEGYLFRGKLKTQEEAALHFLRHVAGRLAFVGQVVTGAKQIEQPERYLRIRAYKRLLLRFYRVVRKDRRFELVEKMLAKQMDKHQSFRQEEQWFKRMHDVRKDVLELWRKRNEVEKVIEEVNAIVVIEDIERFVRSKARKDPRYMLSLSSNLEIARNKVLGLIKHPQLSLNKTFRILEGLRHTEGLGAITHDSSDTSVSDFLKILLDEFECSYYEIPINMRKYFDDVSKALREVVTQEGESYLLHILEDHRTDISVKKLKLNTRLRAQKEDYSGGTYIRSLINNVEVRARKNSGIYKVDIDSKNIFMANIYTFVPAVEQALTDIVESMLRNTRSSTIKISSYYSNRGESGSYVIQILDKSNDMIEASPGRDFANGKILRAIARLNAICGYWFTARFTDGAAYCIDMLMDKSTKCSLDNSIGVVHHLVFPTIGTPNPIHPIRFYFQDRTIKSGRESSNRMPNIEKVLILDNNLKRLKSNTDTLKTIENVKVDARAKIEKQEFMDGGYSVALVHKSNVESDPIYEHWLPHTFPIVFFSGATTSELRKAVEGEYWHTSSNYLQDNIAKIVNEVIDNARLS